MERLTRRDLRALLEFLEASYAFQDIEGFTSLVVSRLPGLIPAEITGYTQADVRQRRILWSRLNPPELDLTQPEARRINERYLEGNPVVPYYLRTGDRSAVTISDFLTRRQFHRLPLYAEWYRSFGTEYQLSVPLQTGLTVLSRVTLNRGRRDFSRRERLLLDLVRPHLLQAYRNAEAVSLLTGDGGPLSRRGLIRLGPGADIEDVTPSALRLLDRFFGWSNGQKAHLPDALERWIRHMEQLFTDRDDAPALRQPFTVSRGARRLVVRLLTGRTQRLLLLEEEDPSTNSDVSGALGLTSREGEVLAWIAQGKTNEVIGIILAISLRTVEKHIESIFRKLGVETRTAAAARLYEVRGFERS